MVMVVVVVMVVMVVVMVMVRTSQIVCETAFRHELSPADWLALYVAATIQI